MNWDAARIHAGGQGAGRRGALDVSAYLVVGPDDTRGRSAASVVAAAVRAGFTAVQLRAKRQEACEQLALLAAMARAIGEAGGAGRVALLVDDRLDVALAARAMGLPVAGVHVGQKDIPAHICRQFLGKEAVVGLSAHPADLPHLAAEDIEAADYIGTGPLYRTASKPDAGLDADGRFEARSLGEIAAFTKAAPRPVIVGGGLRAADLPAVRRTGAAGFFTISAVAGAEEPEKAARAMLAAWNEAEGAGI